MNIADKISHFFNMVKGANAFQTRLIIIVWALFIGFFISWIIIYYNRKVVGSFVNAVLSQAGSDLDGAKTLKELGQVENVSAIQKYAKSSSLQGIVSSDAIIVDETKHLLKIDENTKFYMDEEQKKKASRMYNNVGNSIWGILAGTAGIIVLGIAITAVIVM